MDASLTVKLRKEHFSGNKGPILAKHLVTTLSCILALLTSRRKEHERTPNVTWLISLWGFAQLIRLAVLGAHVKIVSVPVILSMMLLDKYTGALGEIALEYVLILFITSHSKQCSPESGSRRISFPYFTCLAVPSMWLMSMYSVLEDFTGHLVKKFVSSSYEGVLQILHDQLGWLVLVMTLFTSSTVIVFHRRYGSVPANFRKKMK